MLSVLETGWIVRFRPPGRKMKASHHPPPPTNIVDFPSWKPSRCAFPRPYEPTPRRTLIDCHVFEARDWADRSNSSTQSQFNEALNPPASHNSEKMHTTKRSRFSVPWTIPPPPSRSEVDCGVFEECERADPWKWTARSRIGHGFHSP